MNTEKPAAIKPQGRPLKAPPVEKQKSLSQSELAPRKSSLQPSMFYRPVGGEPKGEYGYVNQHGILFPVGLKMYSGDCHISFQDVVMRRCVKCRKHLSATQAIKGECDNEKEDCKYSLVEELDGITDPSEASYLISR